MEVDEAVPQSKPLDSKQVPNSAGGYSWQVTDMDRLRRFLCLGSEGGTYYIGEKQLGMENAMCIDRMIKEGKGRDVVEEIVKYSIEGRTAKQNPILFALAMCARHEDMTTKKLAYEHMKDVCRIPTHLFTFVEYSEALSRGTGWGRAHRRAVKQWYNVHQKQPKRLAMHITKYQNRGGWNHRDILRLAHPKPASVSIAAILRYIIKGLDATKEEFLKDDADTSVKEVLTFLEAVESAKKETDADKVIEMIKTHGLVREHIPTGLLKSTTIWNALLKDMPMTALIRNLGKMSAIGLLTDGAEQTKYVRKRLTDEEGLRKAKIHPFNVLLALKTYQEGHGEKGKLEWQVSDTVKKSLEGAFYLSFRNVEPTGKSHLLALDVSGSMCSPIMGSRAVNARDGSAAMAMVVARTEPTYTCVSFCDELNNFKMTKTMTLEEVQQQMNRLSFGATDCALPMLHAIQKNLKVDVFIVYTDCETWFGKVHPAEALRQYRRHSGVWDAKLIVVGMTSNGFTIADPEDPGMMDIVGFDSAAPEVMRNFTLGML